MRALLALLSLACLVAQPAYATSEPTKLAVMYFDNSGANEQLAMLRLGLAQMLITDLSSSGKYDVLERSRLNELLAELELQKTDSVDPNTAVQAGKLVGAHYMVLGSYFELMGTFRVDARVVEVATGRVVSVGTSGTTAGFMDVQKSIAESIEGAIAESEKRRVQSGGAARPDKAEPTRSTPAPPAVKEPEAAAPAKEPEPTPAVVSADPLGAAMAFSEGLDMLDSKDIKRARAQFERALELDPSLDDARSELAALAI